MYFFISYISVRILSADEECVIWLNTPEKAKKWNLIHDIRDDSKSFPSSFEVTVTS